MQDRFKYRYFNKYANKMVKPTNYENVDSVFECIKQQVCFDSNISPLPYDHIGNGLVFMQCTGLKDKNGKLIYEGDIINGTCGVYWGKMIVKFNENEAKFYMYRVDKRYTDLHFHGKNQEDNFELEVIGNIYENPELLEVEQ